MIRIYGDILNVYAVLCADGKEALSYLLYGTGYTNRIKTVFMQIRQTAVFLCNQKYNPLIISNPLASRVAPELLCKQKLG